MKIIIRGKIPKYSPYTTINGLMTIDTTNDVFWVKIDCYSGKGQYIVELSKFEVAQIINVGLKDAKIVAACRRQRNNPILRDFLGG